MFNKFIIMGRIASDIDLRTTPNGINVATFRIAVDRRFQKKDGEKLTDFFNVVVWRQQADFVHRYFSKGRMILVEGEMTTRSYTDKNGNQATWYEVVADRINFTGEKAESQGGASTPAAVPAPVPTGAPQPSQEFAPGMSDDSYPF